MQDIRGRYSCHELRLWDLPGGEIRAKVGGLTEVIPLGEGGLARRELGDREPKGFPYRLRLWEGVGPEGGESLPLAGART